MELSFAPLEGITSHIFRRVHHSMFSGVDRYYAPFIAPDGSGKYKASHQSGILPENNRDIVLIPQILANAPAPFLAVANELSAMGYVEINLNTGCPSGTVVAKHKGSGMLADLESLKIFLDEIFSNCPMEISIKTRMGLNSTDEFPAIIELFNMYPIKRLTIHARDRVGQYKSQPDLNMFECCLPRIAAQVEYNGNIFSCSDLSSLSDRFPDINNYMIGRGAVAHPSIFRECKGGCPLSAKELHEFHDRLMYAFIEDGLSEYFTVTRMKELWHYWSTNFPEIKKELKALNKSRSLSDYRPAANIIFENAYFDPEAHY